MTERRQDDHEARGRFFAIASTRLGGAICVMLGLLVANGYLAWPLVLGYLLITGGLLATFVVPQILIRKWRSPKE